MSSDEITPKICVIVVTYNRLDSLKEALNRVHFQSLPPAEIVVVNNASKDGTRSFLETFEGFPIHILNLEQNMGFGYGLSVGMKYAMAQLGGFNFFLLSDDDSYSDKYLNENLVRARHSVGLPGIICTEGFVDHWWKGPIPVSQFRFKTSMLINQNPPIYRTDHVLVDGALVDREVVERVGTTREDVFMMCEDLEYCKRIKKAGFSIAVLENKNLVSRKHFGGGVQFSFSTRWRGYYHARNHLLILKDHFTFPSLFAYMIRQTKYLLAALMAPDRIERIKLRMLGVYHGLRGKSGKTLDPESLSFRN